jgi:diguanylate cyclase (GGDEF)-like protein
MLNSIRKKIVFLMVALVVLAVGVATWLHIRSSLTARRQELQERAKDISEFIGLTFSDQLLRKVDVDLEKQNLMRAWIDNRPNIKYFSVFNTAGQEIYSVNSTAKHPPNSDKITPTFLKQAMSSEESILSRELVRRHTYDFLVPVRLFGIHFGLVRLGFNAQRFYTDRNRIIRQNAVFGLVVLLAVVGLGWIVTRFIVNPIKHLESVARRFGGGNLSARANVNSGDEIQHLADQFNTMAAQIKQQIENLRTIEELNRKISARLRPEKLYDRIVNLINNTWDISHIALILKDDQTQSFRIASGYHVDSQAGDISEETTNTLSELSRITDETTDKSVLHRRRSMRAVESLFDIPQDDSFSDGMAFELDRNEADETIGFLLLGQLSDTFEEAEINLLQTLTHQIKIAVQNANNYERAVTDDLTGLYTRRFFEMELENEITSAHHNEEPLSLAMIDIDDFKEYNDTYGHPAGDKVLEDITSVFRNQVRTSDIREASRETDTLARYGGEEFCIILPKTDLAGAKTVSQRIVESVESIEDFERTVTISMGIAQLQEDDNKDTLIQRADNALYQAKDNGKNQVCTNGTNGTDKSGTNHSYSNKTNPPT